MVIVRLFRSESIVALAVASAGAAAGSRDERRRCRQAAATLRIEERAMMSAMSRVVAAILLFPVLQGCGEGSGEPVDEAAAFRALLRELAERVEKDAALVPKVVGKEVSIDKIVVDREPASLLPDHLKMADEARWGFFHGKLPGLRRDTFESFWRRNLDPTVPVFDQAGRFPVVFEEVGPNWALFAFDHPSAMLLCVSAMGFSRDGRQGMVYVVFPNCLGAYYLVGRDGGRWRITEEWDAWVS
jgi:hypothetical protein